ncbi:ABC transporter G family protein, partial [Haematococcus lacustris]
MHALLGPSGAGKSTLMDMLTQRKQVGQLSGQLLLNGRVAGPRAIVHRSAYVPQEDMFVPVMTARETLRFFAAMRLPTRLSSGARDARVEQVLAAVGLTHCQHTMVGGQLPGGLQLRGLSGGEKKRLSLAVGIIAAPAILFLDEPTC